jgi:acetylornithine deacetylase/succinyl-diaminopimelate desuccinylase-like protein
MVDGENSSFHRTIELLQKLIQFNTSNPPGNEGECIRFIQGLLENVGIETRILSKADNRPNLVARIKGLGTAPPLLLYGHVDVVPAHQQTWTHDPFAAKIVDGYVWGRGALDMKGGVAMMLNALLMLKSQQMTPPGDIIFVVLSDEEAGGEFGAKYLVECYPELFEHVKYALGEFGGFSIVILGKRFYPIQIAEKQICSVRLTFNGPGGHGSLPLRNGAMRKLSKALKTLETRPLPIHVTPIARQFFLTVASELTFPRNMLFRQLINPTVAPRILALMGERRAIFEAVLRNTVNATIVAGGTNINVIPSKITLDLDGRLLPGFTPTDMINELKAILDEDVEIEITRHDTYEGTIDMGLFDTLAASLKALDPEGIPIPYLLNAVTDSRYFARIGIQSYGYTPMQLPPDMNFSEIIHAADERIPVEALVFGTKAIFQVLQTFHKGAQ